MSAELLYTSAPQGLKQGSRGFCTVLTTAGMPLNLAQRLESLSGYRHQFAPHEPQADRNPVCHSHLRLTVGGMHMSILSRIAAYGVDYSQRSNKIAHHLVVEAAEYPAAGPAWLLQQPGVCRTTWDGRCITLGEGPKIPVGDVVPRRCQSWEERCGDAGWGGVLADVWLSTSSRPLWIIFTLDDGPQLLGWIAESVALLPESRRWQATFSTLAANLPPDVDCRVRCVLAGTEEARMAGARGHVLDLTRLMPALADSPGVSAARNGVTVVFRSPVRAAASPVSPLENDPSVRRLPDDSLELEPLDPQHPSPFWVRRRNRNAGLHGRQMRWWIAGIVALLIVLVVGWYRIRVPSNVQTASDRTGASDAGAKPSAPISPDGSVAADPAADTVDSSAAKGAAEPHAADVPDAPGSASHPSAAPPAAAPSVTTEAASVEAATPPAPSAPTPAGHTDAESSAVSASSPSATSAVSLTPLPEPEITLPRANVIRVAWRCPHALSSFEGLAMQELEQGESPHASAWRTIAAGTQPSVPAGCEYHFAPQQFKITLELNFPELRGICEAPTRLSLALKPFANLTVPPGDIPQEIGKIADGLRSIQETWPKLQPDSVTPFTMSDFFPTQRLGRLRESAAELEGIVEAYREEAEATSKQVGDRAVATKRLDRLIRQASQVATALDGFCTTLEEQLAQLRKKKFPMRVGESAPFEVVLHAKGKFGLGYIMPVARFGPIAGQFVLTEPALPTKP